MTISLKNPLKPFFLLLGSLLASQALAHGSMEVPISRVYNCYKGNPEFPTSTACKALIAHSGKPQLYEWNAIRQTKANDNHQKFIPDGQLCSGGNSSHRGLDLTRTDWDSTLLLPDADGNFEFVFHATALHATKTLKMFVTREGYDPTKPLKWSDLEEAPFCTATGLTDVDHRYHMLCPLPQGKHGAHVIYAVWQRSDSTEAFYSCSDVSFPEAPAAAATTRWKELGQVLARADLPAQSQVTFRLFDKTGKDLESHSLQLDTATPAATWLLLLAQKVNATSSHVKVGVLQASGEMPPVERRQGNRVYAQEAGLSFQLDVDEPAGSRSLPPPPAPGDGTGCH
jgi:chitin-binding protein